MDAKRQRCDSLSSEDTIVKLNVGGKAFIALQSTLCLDSNSMLGKLFARGSPFSPPRVDNAGCVILDRDADMFALVLAYLRLGGRLVGVPDDVPTLAKLKLEAEYFGLTDLVKQIKSRRPCSDALERAPISDLAVLEFPSAVLIRAGLTPESLKDRGVTVSDLLQNGWSGDVLYEWGFDSDELREAGASAAQVGSTWPRLTAVKKRDIGRLVVADGKFGMVEKVSTSKLVLLTVIPSMEGALSSNHQAEPLAICSNGYIDLTHVHVAVEPRDRGGVTSRFLDSSEEDSE